MYTTDFWNLNPFMTFSMIFTNFQTTVFALVDLISWIFSFSFRLFLYAVYWSGMKSTMNRDCKWSFDLYPFICSFLPSSLSLLLAMLHGLSSHPPTTHSVMIPVFCDPMLLSPRPPPPSLDQLYESATGRDRNDSVVVVRFMARSTCSVGQNVQCDG